jgi:hypothetical protein
MRKLHSVLILFACFALAIPAARANEGGDQYPNGGENWFAGAAPPPGSYYVNYFGFYNGVLKDGFGNNANLNGATPLVDATFNAFRFVEMTPFKLFGADYGVHAIVPVVYQSVNMGGRESTTSIGDMIVNPMILGWHRHNWHYIAAVDVYLPTGEYVKTDPRISIGSNYFGFDPLFAVSYMPSSGWELSGKFMYNMKTTNPATNYHSGQDFHMDYAAGKHVRGWMLGATGYFLEQMTDDTVGGQIVPAAPELWDAGRKGQVFAAGPSVGYESRRHMSFMVQWQHEMLVENRFGGDKVWFKMILPIASFSHGPKN